MKKLLCWPVATLSMLAFPALAESDTDMDADTDGLERITVIASKSERPAREIAAPVTVIDAEEIERIMAENIGDMMRYEPGVTVPFQGQRFGLGGFNIRGLGGNRVQILMDGVRIPDAFAIGDFANAARNFVDVESLKQVEVLRGPASSLFGSSALGGVVAFATRDPADWLRDDRRVGGRVRGGYYSADGGWVASGTLAAAGTGFSGLINYVERRGDELDNQGDVGGTGATRTKPNPHEYTDRNVLAKLLYGEGTDSQWRLTADANVSDSETEVLSLVRTQDFTGQFGFPYVVETSRLDADDLARRHRVSLDHQWLNPGPLDRVEWRVYWQDSLTRQDTFEDRVTMIMGQGGMNDSSPVRRFRRARFEQDILGGEFTAQKRFSTGAVDHDLVAGFEIFRTDTTQSRDGLETDLATGESSNVVGPDSFPVRDFPDSRSLEAGLYAEDRIRIGERLTLIPGVRVDHYRLDPDVDDIFREDNPDIEPVDLRETSVSPRLGAIFAIAGGVDLFAQYARGFRSPPFNDVNVGFTNVQFGYTAIPNPDLKPETSHGFEAGIKGEGEAGSFSLSGYENRYRDFIESFVSLGVDPESGLLVFQSQNLTKVRIRGVEFNGLLNLGVLTPALADWRIRAAAAWARGDDRSAGEPLDSIDPFSGVLGIQWRPAAIPVEAELVATGAARKDRVAGDGAFRPGGYVVLDFMAGWRIGDSAVLRAGIYNIADRHYWAWSDVRGRGAGDLALDRYTRPGRNFGVSLSWNL